MFIKIGYDIAVRFPVPTTVVHSLHVHPSRRSDLVEPERISIIPALGVEEYYDSSRSNHLPRRAIHSYPTRRWPSDKVMSEMFSASQRKAHEPPRNQRQAGKI
jgi:hypothetical protein